MKVMRILLLIQILLILGCKATSIINEANEDNFSSTSDLSSDILYEDKPEHLEILGDNISNAKSFKI